MSSVVYLGSPTTGLKSVAGAPCTPANTWFQTLLLQPATEPLRTRNCCWLPLTTYGSVESAMNPPDAYCGPAVQ